MYTLLSKVESLALAPKIYRNSVIRALWSCPTFLDFLTFPKMFQTGFYAETNFRLSFAPDQFKLQYFDIFDEFKAFQKPLRQQQSNGVTKTSKLDTFVQRLSRVLHSGRNLLAVVFLIDFCNLSQNRVVFSNQNHY